MFGYQDETVGAADKKAVSEKAASEKAASEKNAEVSAEEKTAGEAAEAEKVLYAPVKGNVIRREEIPDETFASGILGDGVGIEPEVGEVVAPFDGEISAVTDTLHAIGLSGPGNVQVLIHVGIDTVQMQGDGFKLLVAQGDHVKAGQKLLTFDIEKIKKAGFSTTTAVLIANSMEYASVQVEKTGKTEQMEKLITIK